MSKKLQDAQTFNIHVVPEDFLKEIQTDRPTIVMEKLKISSWGILPHIRKQNKIIEDEKIKSGRSTFGSLDGKSDCKYFHFISISISFVFISLSSLYVTPQIYKRIRTICSCSRSAKKNSCLSYSISINIEREKKMESILLENTTIADPNLLSLFQ